MFGLVVFLLKQAKLKTILFIQKTIFISAMKNNVCWTYF